MLLVTTAFYYITIELLYLLLVVRTANSAWGYGSNLAIPPAPFWVGFKQIHTKILRQIHTKISKQMRTKILRPIYQNSKTN